MSRGIPLAKLEEEFTAQLWADHRYARTHGFKAPKGNRYEQMLRRHGGSETAHRLLRNKVQPGLTDCAELGLLNISIESRVIELRWRPLFSPAEIAEAQRRLDAQRRLLAQASQAEVPSNGQPAAIDNTAAVSDAQTREIYRRLDVIIAEVAAIRQGLNGLDRGLRGRA
jgi:hypothetical protein